MTEIALHPMGGSIMGGGGWVAEKREAPWPPGEKDLPLLHGTLTHPEWADRAPAGSERKRRRLCIHFRFWGDKAIT